jgi:hypothetical protein
MNLNEAKVGAGKITELISTSATKETLPPYFHHGYLFTSTTLTSLVHQFARGRSGVTELGHTRPAMTLARYNRDVPNLTREDGSLLAGTSDMGKHSPPSEIIKR